MSSLLPFTPRLPPLPYQLDYLLQHGEEEAWGLFWHQGTGKSKSLIDNAALLFCRGKIDGMLTLAPNGVHREWVNVELPKHWPLDTPKPCLAFEWNTAKAVNKGFQRDFAEFLRCTAPGGTHFGVLCMSYDGLMTDAGKQASWDFMRKRSVLYAADESQRFKEPSSKRNIRVYASSAYAPYRRIASGTPMDKPFDVYPQMRFLDADFWRKSLGLDGFTAFKAHLGNWEKMTINSGKTFDVLSQKNPYKNLDQLQAALALRTTRISEEEAEKDLPAKRYHRIGHPLSLEQRTAYDELAEECLTVLSNGQLVTAEHVLTMRLRLMQVGAGFITPAAGEEPIPFATNPREEAVADLLYRLGPGEPTLQWCLWKNDYAALLCASARAGRRAVVYNSNDPEGTLDAWKRGQYHDLIGNLGSGLTEGHTLVRARNALFYTNTPRLIARQQAEKRNHRIGQTADVDYHDFLAEGTLDDKNLEAVRRKAGFVGEALGDSPLIAAGWLRASLRGEDFTPDFSGGRGAAFPTQEELNFSPDDYEAAFRA